LLCGELRGVSVADVNNPYNTTTGVDVLGRPMLQVLDIVQSLRGFAISGIPKKIWRNPEKTAL
jgi:hypothetical protein